MTTWAPPERERTRALRGGSGAGRPDGRTPRRPPRLAQPGGPVSGLTAVRIAFPPARAGSGCRAHLRDAACAVYRCGGSAGIAEDPLTGFPYDPRGSVRSRSRGAITAIPDDGGSYGDEDDYIDDGIGFGVDPRFHRQLVAYNGPHAPGTIIIDTPSRFLYLVQPGKRAIRYGIGVGRPGFTWAGRKSVTMKRKWPEWRPPTDMLRRRPDLPRYMSGGLDNPLGARALYLGSSLYRIHGTNEPHTIGHAVSSGCIRMLNSDVVDLYNRVKVGTPVVVI